MPPSMASWTRRSVSFDAPQLRLPHTLWCEMTSGTSAALAMAMASFTASTTWSDSLRMCVA